MHANNSAAATAVDHAVSLLTPQERTVLKKHDARSPQLTSSAAGKRMGSRRTDAPRVFHTMTAIALVAAATDRNLYLDLKHKRVYPSCYILNLSASGTRKTTPLQYGEDVAATVLEAPPVPRVQHRGLHR